MPKITFIEKDLTSPGILNVTANTVYVPGFSVSGPVNKPTLLNSVQELKETFGCVEGSQTESFVTFSETFTYNGKNIFTANQKEPGYLYAKSLLEAGLSVIFERLTPNTGTSGAEITTITGLYAYSKLLEALGSGRLTDCGTYNIKFLTSGGYPNKCSVSSETDLDAGINSIGLALYIIASTRKDCVALIDHTPDINPENLLACITESKDSFGEYGAMFTPWGSYQVSGEDFDMPASFGYLLALARSTSSNPNWLAVAGATRGGVPNLIALNETITNAVAESYQSRTGVSINPITEINPYGNLIWGNRTLKFNTVNLTAKSFLNIRVLICDVVKTAFAAARAMTFEQNNDILWVNFKSMIIPTLDQMVKGAGISAYELKKRANKQKAELRCVIRLYAIEAVEDFEIELQLADDTSAVIA